MSHYLLRISSYGTAPGLFGPFVTDDEAGRGWRMALKWTVLGRYSWVIDSHSQLYGSWKVTQKVMKPTVHLNLFGICLNYVWTFEQHPNRRGSGYRMLSPDQVLWSGDITLNYNAEASRQALTPWRDVFRVCGGWSPEDLAWSPPWDLEWMDVFQMDTQDGLIIDIESWEWWIDMIDMRYSLNRAWLEIPSFLVVFPSYKPPFFGDVPASFVQFFRQEGSVLRCSGSQPPGGLGISQVYGETMEPWGEILRGTNTFFIDTLW